MAAIGVVIGHEITHGYDDQGRKYDADGNLNDWWTDGRTRRRSRRARKKWWTNTTRFEPLPGLHVNGKLTLGENMADLGGVTIAYDALERALAKDPSKRKTIDGFTPEQRFFISFAQIWRTNIGGAAARAAGDGGPAFAGPVPRHRAAGEFAAVLPGLQHQGRRADVAPA